MKKRILSMILSGTVIFSLAVSPVLATESGSELSDYAVSGTEDSSDTDEADETGSGNTRTEESSDTDAAGESDVGNADAEDDSKTDTGDETDAGNAETEESEGADTGEESDMENGDDVSDGAAGDSQDTDIDDDETVTYDDGLVIDDMRINLLSEPFGVSADSLRFSWSIVSDQNDTMQTAYRIVVAETLQQVEESDYVYDTGWVDSDADTDVAIGMEAEENQLYYWQVQVKDNYGRTGYLSEAQAFSTAAGSALNSSKGIWTGTGDYVFLRSEKTIDMSNVEKIIFTATAISPEDTRQYVYNLYINGECVGMGPSRVNDAVLYYNTFDITDYVQNGNNVVGVICYSETGHAFLGQMTAYYKDGTSKVLLSTDTSHNSWLALAGDSAYGNTSFMVSNTSYYTQVAENIDSTVYPHGWLETGYSTSSWTAASAVTGISAYTLEPEETDNMSRYEVTPQSVTKLSDGSYLIDFGEEISGSLELTINSSSKQSISIYYGEELNSDGSVKYSMRTGNVYTETWTLKSGNQQISGLNMKNFRYVQISGCTNTISKSNIKGLQVRQEFTDEASDFSCSNEILNDEYDLAKYTILSTTQSLYVDTQSRERQVYSGDLLINMTTAFSMESDYSVAKRSLDYAISNPTWPAEYLLYSVLASWQYYLYSDDTEFLEEHYEQLQSAMARFTVDSTGLVKKPSLSILVDWPTGERDGYDTTNSYYNTVLNAVYVGACESMADISRILGKDGYAASYSSTAQSVKSIMIDQLYDEDEGRFRDGLTSSGDAVDHYAQHATAFALAYGIYSDQDMADTLADSISEDGLNQTSVYATYFMLQGLYRSNNGTLARQIMSDPSTYEGSHTWANMLYNVGATVATEAWDSSVKSNMSYSHAWGSAPGTWIVTGLFGIAPTSGGYKTFDVKLQPGGVEEASVTVPTLQGSIEAAYAMDGQGGITLTISVPANTQARILIPAEDVSNAVLTVDGSMLNAETAEGQYLVVTLGSGKHTVSGGSGIYTNSSEMAQNENVVYRTYGSSWGSYETNGNMSGSTGEAQALYRLSLRLNTQTDGGIRYTAYAEDEGWLDWCYDGDVNSVTTKMIQAVRIKLTGDAADTWDVYYRVHCQTYGWLDWAKNGEVAGTLRLGKRMEAIEVVLVPKGDEAPGETTNSYVGTLTDEDLADTEKGSAADTLVVRRGNVYYFSYKLVSGEADAVVAYGRDTDEVYVGDWDGDGIDTLCVRRGNVYYFKNDLSSGDADVVIAYGRTDDEVLVGDWDGDGKDTLAVRRDNVYYIKNSITSGDADSVIAYGRTGDVVLSGDWDGDGMDTLTVRRDNVYYIKNSIASGDADSVIAYGRTTDDVLVGDWDGDGMDTLTVRRDNIYYIKNSIASGDADSVIAYGRATDIVYVGTWKK